MRILTLVPLLAMLACDILSSPNLPPETVAPIPDQEDLFVGDAFQVNLDDHFSDGNDDPLTYSATSLLDVVSVAVSGSTLTGGALRRGDDEIAVRATDPDGATALLRFVAKVGNRQPEPAGVIPIVEVLPEKGFTLDLGKYFADPDGDPLRYHARAEPGSRIEIKVNGATLTGTVGRTRGTKTVLVTAIDDGSLRVTRPVSVEVLNVAPEVVRTIPDRQAYPEQIVRIPLGEYFQDLNDDPITYRAASDGLVFVAVTSSNRLNVQAQRARGSTEVSVTATDPPGEKAAQRFNFTVANRPPRVRDGPPLLVRPGSRVIVEPRSYFTDADGDPLTYAGVSQSAAVQVAAGGRSLTLVIGETTAEVPVTVRATDGFGDTVQAVIPVVPYQPTALAYREDFDSAGSLNDWTARHTRGRVLDGMLELDWKDQVATAHEYQHIPAHMYRDVRSAGNWEVRFKMGWKAGDEPAGVFLVFTPKRTWPIWELDIHYGIGWAVLISQGGTSWWKTLAGDTRPFSQRRRLREYTWLSIDGVMMVAEGERILHWDYVANSWPDDSDSPPTGLTGIGVGSYFQIEDEDGVRVDWVEVNSVKKTT